MIKKEGKRILRLHYSDEQIGYFAISSDYSRPKGYIGLTVIGIWFNAELEITEVKIISSEDTRSYVRKVKTKRFLSQFISWQQDTDVTTVTGATITSKAIIISIRETVEMIRKKFN
jgi:Na+-translocating ferredoxin:NAD+ oxidoreductase RnfG subunit